MMHWRSVLDPRWLIARWVERWGEQDTERLLTLNNADARS